MYKYQMIKNAIIGIGVIATMLLIIWLINSTLAFITSYVSTYNNILNSINY